jgi:hypothetical protein
MKARKYVSIIRGARPSDGSRRQAGDALDPAIVPSVPGQARLQLSLPAYALGNLWRRLLLPKRIDAWSLTSLQQRLFKTGGRLVKHAC